MCRIECILLVVALTVGRAAAQTPPIGTDTGGGFKVAAHWQFHYRSKVMMDSRTMGGPLRSLDAPLNYEEETIGEADVSEEVNKSTGQIRAEITHGRWSVRISGLHYTEKHGNRVAAGDDADDSGEFKHAAIGYGYDEKLKQNTVHFAITSNEGTETRKFKVPYHPLDEKGFDVWVSSKLDTIDFVSGVSGGCDVPFKKSYIYYRKRTPEDGSDTPYTEIVIERSAREVEAEIKPADDFENWVPTLNGVAGFSARMVDPPGLAVDWHVSLSDVSNLPGVCNDADIPPAIKKAWQNRITMMGPDLLFDFRRYGVTDKSFKPLAKPWKELYTAKPTGGISVAVSCLDWGGYGRISAKALVDGHWTDAKWPKTNEEFIRIPWALTDGPANHMAVHAKTPRGEEKYTGRDPNEDKDDQPPGALSCKGDGLTVFQEYRGFYVRDADGKFTAGAAPVFQRLDPDKKDVFIFMDDQTDFLLGRYLADFQKASGLSVHHIGGKERWLRIDPDFRYANFNRALDDDPQCAIQLCQASLTKEDVLGDTAPHIGPPRRVKKVRIDYAKCADITSKYPFFGNLAQHTVVHELGHAVGIAHHGDSDYHASCTIGGTKASCVVAKEGGQHSGDSNCPMKYIVAAYYLHKSSPAEPSPTPQGYDGLHDRNGLLFCNSKTGSGLNDKSKPSWHCGDADRGNCAGQIMVNDKCTNPTYGEEEMRIALNTAAPDRSVSAEDDSRRNVSAELNVSRQQIVAGEPLVLELHIVPLPAEDATTQKQNVIGSGGHRWTDEVTLKVTDARHKEFPIKCRPIGAVEKLSSDPSTPPVRGLPDQLKMTADAIYTAKFVVEGSETEKLTGKVTMTASLLLSDGALSSSSAAVTINTSEDLPAAKRNQVPVLRTLAEAEVAFAAEKYAEAEKLARQVTTSQPDSFEAHLILGRALLKQEKLKDAYDAFSRALELRRPTEDSVDEPPYEILLQMQQIAAKLGLQAGPLATSDVLSAHELFATSSNGRMAPPFHKSVNGLSLRWELAPQTAADSLGVRWIAEDVPGAATDHIIATSKADPNKRAGEFNLTKPTAGFPPGKYRVEIWQAGKTIYTEKFEISP